MENKKPTAKQLCFYQELLQQLGVNASIAEFPKTKSEATRCIQALIRAKNTRDRDVFHELDKMQKNIDEVNKKLADVHKCCQLILKDQLTN